MGAALWGRPGPGGAARHVRRPDEMHTHLPTAGYDTPELEAGCSKRILRTLKNGRKRLTELVDPHFRATRGPGGLARELEVSLDVESSGRKGRPRVPSVTGPAWLNTMRERPALWPASGTIARSSPSIR